jgi:hypothetical protein
LDDPGVGLYLPAMTWAHLYEFTPETVCLALASTHYDPSKVIRNWAEYCALAEKLPA